MNEQQCIEKMVAPGTPRPGKYRQGVIQIHVTRACNLSCYNCTQGSNLAGRVEFMSPEHFEQAVWSLGFRYPVDASAYNPAEHYFGVVGVFGGNPAMSPHFADYCSILRTYVPYNQRGVWSNHPKGNGAEMRGTFDPGVSNLNVHLDREAYDEFKRDWPECRPVGLDTDSRHAPVHLAMRDVVLTTCNSCSGAGGYYDHPNGDRYLSDEGITDWTKCVDCGGTGKEPDESRIWELISGCDINQHWSAMIAVFRGQLRAYFCEVAGAQAILHQDESDYPADTGKPLWTQWQAQLPEPWWKQSMPYFTNQVRKHCFECGVPLRGHGELSQAREGLEQTSQTHADIYRPKRPGRKVEVVTDLVQLGVPMGNVVRYLQNSKL